MSQRRPFRWELTRGVCGTSRSRRPSPRGPGLVIKVLATIAVSLGTALPAEARWLYNYQRHFWFWCDDIPVIRQQYQQPSADGGFIIGVLSFVGLIIWLCVSASKRSTEATDEPDDSDKARRKIELMNLKQQLRAQRDFGAQFHDLEWRKKIGEQALHVAEQQAILDEHREKIARRSKRDRDRLLAERAELRADGLETGEIDAALLGKGGRT